MQVYKLYFEDAKPVIKIAEMLGVNRNTINEDVRYWYSQLASEITSETVVSSALKQIHNMELQKARLREQLDGTTEFSQRMSIEKLLLEIDSKLGQYVAKIMSGGKELIKQKDPDVPEEDIKKLLRDLILKNEDPFEDADVYSEEQIKFEVIRKTNCDTKYADSFLQKMKSLGLDLCKQEKTNDRFLFDSDFSSTYNLAKFANLRGYITIDEFAKITQKRIKLREEIKKLEEEEKSAASNLKDGNDTRNSS